MIEYLAADGADLPPYVASFLNFGAVGALVVLLLLGFLVPKSTYQELKKDRDEWRSTAEKLRQANEALTAALDKANETGAASLEVARMTQALLTSMHNIGQRSGAGQ